MSSPYADSAAPGNAPGDIEADLDEEARPGGPVRIDYSGAPLSPWQAAWIFAQVMTDEFGRRPEDQVAEVGVILARAITIQAKHQRLLPADPATLLATPAELADVSLNRVAVDRLHLLKATIEFIKPQLGTAPRWGESGYAAYGNLIKLMSYGAEVADDPALDAQCQRDTKIWESYATSAFNVAVATTDATAVTMNDELTLGWLGGYVNDHLARQR